MYYCIYKCISWYVRFTLLLVFLHKGLENKDEILGHCYLWRLGERENRNGVTLEYLQQ